MLTSNGYELGCGDLLLWPDKHGAIELVGAEGSILERREMGDNNYAAWKNLFVEDYSQKRTRQHLECGGCKCPYCSSEVIRDIKIKIMSVPVEITFQCRHCDKVWKNTYKLYNMEEE